MPSRPVVVLIALFWAGTLGLAFYRDVWPRLAASGPPPMTVDLGDEVTQLNGVKWQLTRGGQPAGRLVTKTTYLDADDTFRFTHKYTNVQLDFGEVRVAFPEVTIDTRVDRAGALREQAMAGRMAVQLARRNRAAEGGYDTVAEATAEVTGKVVDGVFVGRCKIVAPVAELAVDADLDPVPAPGGQALSPLQPVNRLGNVRPGRRWAVHPVDPLGEAVAALLKKTFGGFGLPDRPREPLLAEVSDRPEPLPGGGDPCWVITYRQDGEERAKTWVRVEDGKVMRQEAYLGGERISLEREER